MSNLLNIQEMIEETKRQLRDYRSNKLKKQELECFKRLTNLYYIYNLKQPYTETRKTA